MRLAPISTKLLAVCVRPSPPLSIQPRYILRLTLAVRTPVSIPLPSTVSTASTAAGTAHARHWSRFSGVQAHHSLDFPVIMHQQLTGKRVGAHPIPIYMSDIPLTRRRAHVGLPILSGVLRTACRDFILALEACHADTWAKFTGGCNNTKIQLNKCLHEQVRRASYLRSVCLPHVRFQEHEARGRKQGESQGETGANRESVARPARRRRRRVTRLQLCHYPLLSVSPLRVVLGHSSYIILLYISRPTLRTPFRRYPHLHISLRVNHTTMCAFTNVFIG